MPKPNITPPIRLALLTQNGSPLATGNGDIETSREWWMYWNKLGDQVNGNSKLATDGGHADRPVTDNMPEGAIYIENDRGVIYQNQGGNWQYVAGTMYGSLSPDQRPTDLGVYDGGFEFRANDSDPADTGRTFLWNQTAWVEITPVLYGTHAVRPLPADAPARCIFVETDRGAIYQNQIGVWTYLAGTMWGTLVPDQRPTDLGLHDAGFDFRSVSPPPREFIWNQTAWIETTPGGGFTTQSTVTGSRVLGTTYPNATGKAMLVTVSCVATTGGAQAFTDSLSTGPTTQVAYATTTGTSIYFSLTFVVLSGNYYRVVSQGVPGATINTWTEWS